MLRVDGNGNVFGFIGEGGHVDFYDLPQNYGEIILRVKGKETLEKRSLIFGEQNVSFVFTEEDIKQIGEGEHPYYLILIDEDGSKSTLIPDPSTSVKPKFIIEEQ